MLLFLLPLKASSAGDNLAGAQQRVSLFYCYAKAAPSGYLTSVYECFGDCVASRRIATELYAGLSLS